MKNIENWKDYEDFVFETISERHPEYSYERNIRVDGRVTKVKRQIDIAFNGTILGHKIFGVIDCKKYAEKLDVKDVEAFVGFLNDVGADIGILITNQGYSKAAQNLAEFSKVKLDILTPEELEDYEIEFYFCEECDSGDHVPLIQWHGSENISGDGDKVQDVGWCDLCHTIHIKCLVCGEVTGVPDVNYGSEIKCVGECGTRFIVTTTYESKGTEEELKVFLPDL
jgi:hypothetical protein